MKRREFITLLGGTAAWPLAARAQQAERMRRIGILLGISENDLEAQSRVAAFRKGLRDLGWIEGRNVQDYRFAAADLNRVKAYAAELVQLSSRCAPRQQHAGYFGATPGNHLHSNRFCRGQ
jgi:putative ABC transport system substrate-binding protein